MDVREVYFNEEDAGQASDDDYDCLEVDHDDSDDEYEEDSGDDEDSQTKQNESKIHNPDIFDQIDPSLLFYQTNNPQNLNWFISFSLRKSLLLFFI